MGDGIPISGKRVGRNFQDSRTESPEVLAQVGEVAIAFDIAPDRIGRTVTYPQVVLIESGPVEALSPGQGEQMLNVQPFTDTLGLGGMKPVCDVP